jgi:hypothetical protein
VHLSHRCLPLLLLAFTCICTPSSFAQTTTGTIRGEVTDTSGGVLPGVTVSARTADDQTLASTITGEMGQFELHDVPVGTVRVVFELDGFETDVVAIVMTPGSTSSVVERLKLARMTEEVVVYGKAPPPPPAPLPRWEPPPAPVVVPVPQRELESVCRPARPGASASPVGTIKAHRYAYGRELYAKGDELVITGGTNNGLEVGRNLIVLRYFRANSKSAAFPEMGEHTAGLVQIIAATESSARAVVVHACNELRPGDLLAAFTPEYVEPTDESGEPSYEDAARILHADAGQLVGAPRRMLVIDRGSAQGIQRGNRLTLFRVDTRRTVLGEAVVVSVRPNSSTIRVVSATDAIEFGDWAAPQRPVQP